MDLRQMLYLILMSFVREIPQFIVIGIGIFLCLSNRAKSPKASKIALGGLLILLLTAFLGLGLTLFYTYLPFWFRDSFQTVGYINFAVGTLVSIISAVGLGLIVYAVWVERK